MHIKTINPANGKLLQSYPCFSPAEIDDSLQQAQHAFAHWSQQSFATRGVCFKRLADILDNQQQQYASLITSEMGKPISQAKAEIKKCAWICRYFAEQASHYLQPYTIATEHYKSEVVHEPLGVIFAIMPWNFPFWQVLRFAAPNLMAGNVGVLKHASICTGTALALQDLFEQAGFAKHVFTSLIIENEQVKSVIAHPAVKGVTLTGSARAGKAVASLAGASLKKSVLELGGSDPYLILADADIAQAAEICVQARMAVSGQVCISAKRLIVVESVYDAFKAAVLAQLKQYQADDPKNNHCHFGPMARADLRDTLHQQVQASIKAGAHCILGGKPLDRPGFYYAPTVLENITQHSPAYTEELFGPVVCLFKVKNEAEAIRLANDSEFALGAAVFTQEREHGEAVAKQLNAGVCAVNTAVASDPRLPFGGINASGYGRECAREGITEFVNIKTLNVA